MKLKNPKEHAAELLNRWRAARSGQSTETMDQVLQWDAEIMVTNIGTAIFEKHNELFSRPRAKDSEDEDERDQEILQEFKDLYVELSDWYNTIRNYDPELQNLLTEDGFDQLWELIFDDIKKQYQEASMGRAVREKEPAKPEE